MAEETRLQLLARQRATAAPAATSTPTTEPPIEDDFEPGDYIPSTTRCYSQAPGIRRQAGFALVLRSGDVPLDMPWIQYHKMARMRFLRLARHDSITFAHESLVITIEGQRLVRLYALIGEGRLKAIFDPQLGAVTPDKSDEPILSKIMVTDIEEAARQQQRAAASS